MSTKEDEGFAVLAADAIQRQAAILRLTRARNLMGWLALVTLVINVISTLCGDKMSGANAFSNALMCILAVKYDSDVKILKAIDMMCAANKLPTSDAKDVLKETPSAVLPASAGI